MFEKNCHFENINTEYFDGILEIEKTNKYKQTKMENSFFLFFEKKDEENNE